MSATATDLSAVALAKAEALGEAERQSPTPPCRAVFLDRDGVINRPFIRNGKPYPPRSLDEFELLPGVDKACQMLKETGFLLIVATNQPDVGRGTLQREAVEQIHAAMLEQVPIDRVMVCYHGGEKAGDPCDCRKPRPGMLLNAAKELRIDLARSFMVGDRWRDIECGARAGCQTIFIDWGYKESLTRLPDRVAKHLLDAAGSITNSQ
jgi:D-glycero-D-manno-heptose 1,7-bisphosphate phosphatase